MQQHNSPILFRRHRKTTTFFFVALLFVFIVSLIRIKQSSSPLSTLKQTHVIACEDEQKNVVALNGEQQHFSSPLAAPSQPQSHTTTTNNTSPLRTPKILAIFARYADDIYWLQEENTGIMNNSTGNPSFILPLEIYQACDVGNDGHPIFPGLPTAAKLNESNPLPIWPEWGYDWAIKKNKTKHIAWPGSSHDAEMMMRYKLGLPLGFPKEKKEWDALESRISALKTAQQARDDLLIANEDGNAGYYDDETMQSIHQQQQQQTQEETGNHDTTFHGETIILNEEDQNNEVIYQQFQSASVNHSSIVNVPSVSIHNLHLTPNRGGEAMAYLTAIIDHYDDEDFPDYMLFMHGHRLAWHTILAQDWTLRRIASHPPDPETFSQHYGGYMPLGCRERWMDDISQLFPTEIDANWRSNNGPRWHEALAGRYTQAWREHLGSALNMQLPEFVRVPSAASFILTKENIKRRPKQWYIDLRQWMLSTRMENKFLGIVIEFSWGIIFGGSPYVNPSQEQCLCAVYSICSGYSQV